MSYRENPAWEPVIGLEIHVQLATKSKLFSGASTAYLALQFLQQRIQVFQNRVLLAHRIDGTLL